MAASHPVQPGDRGLRGAGGLGGVSDTPAHRRGDVPGVARRSRRTARDRGDGRRGASPCGTPTTILRGVDAVVLPGGFSYGDYLRCGAIAARAPLDGGDPRVRRPGTGPSSASATASRSSAKQGSCPGALIRNASLRFVCEDVWLRVETSQSVRHGGARAGRDDRGAGQARRGAMGRDARAARARRGGGARRVPLRGSTTVSSATRSIRTAPRTTSPASATPPATWSG